MLNIVARCRQNVCHQLELVHLCLLAHFANSSHMVESLWQVGGVCPIVVSYIVVQILYPTQKSKEFQLIQLHFFEYTFFCHYVSNCRAQLLTLHVRLEIENVKIVQLNFFKFLYSCWRTFHLLLNNLSRYDSGAHKLVSRCQRQHRAVFLWSNGWMLIRHIRLQRLNPEQIRIELRMYLCVLAF